jgi:hypothetical protein
MPMKMPMSIAEKIARWKDKSEVFLENDIKCFIKTLDGGFYSGQIMFIGENSLTIYDIVRKQNIRLYWLDMTLFEEFKEKEKNNENKS